MLPIIDLADTVVVFDLDDTLYPEEAYVRSGIVAVCRMAADLFGTDHTDALLALRDAGERDWLSALRERTPPGAQTRDCLLWAYRLHAPNITLEPGVRAVVDRVIAEACATAILTDGRSITQRLKLRALGLAELPVYISDEYGGQDKPNPTRYRAVMTDFPAKRYVYVADNPAKDFVTAKALGWMTVGVTGSVGRVHTLAETTDAHAPDRWIPAVGNLFDR